MAFYSNLDEATLLALLSGGDEGAFTEIYNRYWDRLLFTASAKMKDLYIAEELVQDIFLDIWRRRAEIDFQDQIGPYLAVSLKHKVINAQARIKRGELYRAYASKNNPANENTTENWLDFEESRHKLAQLVSNLPEKCRITYQLSRDEGLSNRDIAAKLKITQKAVEGNITRALKSLRTGLTQLFFVLSLLLLLSSFF